MRFASLGSGSRGNALVVESGSTRVLLDCGFGPKDLARRLGRLGLATTDINAVLLTHEHSDHVAGAFAMARRFDVCVWLTHGTAAAVGHRADLPMRRSLIDSHTPFAIGDLEIHPYPVPHDAREPVQFVFSDGSMRLGVLTDIGHATAHVAAMLSGCEGLVLETNHDATMLANGRYPVHLKRRIAGRYGHLDNGSAAALLAGLDRRRLQHVVAAHLSEQNNTPELACDALAGAMGCTSDWIGVATQEDGLSWRALG